MSAWFHLYVVVLILEPGQGGSVVMGTGIPGVLGPLLKAPILTCFVQIWLDTHALQPTRGDKSIITTRMVLVRVCPYLEGVLLICFSPLARTRSIYRIDWLPDLPNAGKHIMFALFPLTYAFFPRLELSTQRL